MPAPSPAQLAAGLAVVQALVDAVDDGQWHAPTPCAGWDVRALVGHLAAGNRLFADALAGRTAPDGASANPPGDVLGDRPAGAFAEAAAAVVAAFGAPGALERTVTVPFGTVPGAVALHLRITEVLVHGWDLARATGRTPSFDDAVVEQELAFSRQALTQLPPGRTPFAPATAVAGDAPPIDRLAALLGRAVTA